jgi:hypothetical protein
MKEYRVVVVETQYYEVYVEADTEEEAMDIAQDIYGTEGVVFSEGTNIELVEEENEDE